MAVHQPLTKRLLATVSQTRCYSAPAERVIPEAKRKYVPSTGTYPKGFLAGSAYAGVKSSNTKFDDISFIVSEELCPAAAVFTRNVFKAAPVQFSRSMLNGPPSPSRGPADPVKLHRGVIVNSGCANAVTGSQGLSDAKTMAQTADACFETSGNSPGSQTLVMSTGVIGQLLPIEKIKSAIPKAHAALGATHDHWLRAARAICTTDTFPKLISRTFTLPSHPDTQYSLAGMTKGAGMIHPNMGTLLGTVCTDARIEADSMHPFLQRATSKSFNCISIDGDTSTNDTVAFFANAAAAPEGTPALRCSDSDHGQKHDNEQQEQDSKAFQSILNEFMIDLAKLVVRDGEGATKFIAVTVKSDCAFNTAKAIASSVAKSSLVKTALYGQDANWGRILCAIGYTDLSSNSHQGDPVDPTRTSVSFRPADGSEPLKLLVRGEPEQVDEARAKDILQMEDLEIFIELNDTGNADDKALEEVTFWTCDLSHEYVTINGDYRT